MLPIQTILYPTDFSERSACAFPLACALARDHGARLIVLHVTSVPAIAYLGGVMPSPQIVKDRDELRQKLEELRAPGVRVEHRVLEGDAVTEILRTAREYSAELIVMGTHGWTGFSRLLLGSVAESVLRRATCPVLTVKAPFSTVAAWPSEEQRDARGALEPTPAGAH